MSSICSVQPSKMSARPILVCKHCKRKDFKSALGLKQNQRRNRFCLEMAKKDADILTQVLPVNSEQNVRNKPSKSRPRSGQMQDNTEQRSGFSGDDSDDGAFAGHNDDSSESSINLDDISVNEIDAEADAELKLLFRSYCEEKNNHTLPFRDSHTQAIRLALLLVKQSASLESYNKIFEWYLGASGKKPSWQPLGESQHYISRKKLMKLLHDLGSKSHVKMWR